MLCPKLNSFTSTVPVKPHTALDLNSQIPAGKSHRAFMFILFIEWSFEWGHPVNEFEEKGPWSPNGQNASLKIFRLQPNKKDLKLQIKFLLICKLLSPVAVCLCRDLSALLVAKFYMCLTRVRQKCVNYFVKCTETVLSWLKKEINTDCWDKMQTQTPDPKYCSAFVLWTLTSSV